MGPLVPGLAAALLYLAVAMLQLTLKTGKPLVVSVGAVAVILHAVACYLDLNDANGFNLGLFPMLSLCSLAVALTVLLSSLRRPVENLFIVIFPVAALAIVMELVFVGSYTPRPALSGGIVTHIVLSIIAYGLLTVTAMQAAFLSFGDYELRHRKLEIVKKLPPLETMDALLFEMLGAGLIFLSLSIVTGFVFLENIRDPGLIHHTVITFAAWLVFVILLWGRLKLGWRGAVASRWALSGFALLVLGYFGSKLVLELILNRG